MTVPINYFPLPQMGLTVQSIAGLLPFAHMGYFLRRLMMTEEIYKLIPQEYLTNSGISQVKVFGATIPIYLVFIASTAVAIGLLVLTYIKMNKKQV